MSDLPPCPKCNSAYAYEDPSGLLVCPECGNEWSPAQEATASADDGDTAGDAGLVVRDSVGNILQDGDTVVLIKDLKVKGSPTGLKAGTKVKKIRLVDGDHNIDCRVDGIGQMGLKSEFVKKV
jgi:protein PhnA